MAIDYMRITISEADSQIRFAAAEKLLDQIEHCAQHDKGLCRSNLDQ